LPSKRPRVGLLIQSSLEYGRGLLRGIGQYVAEHGPWTVYYRPGPLVERLPAGFTAWRPDALLAQLESAALIRQVRALGLPTVDLFTLHPLAGIPRLSPDHRAVARLVADYFLERGYEHFAYCGFRGVWYCEMRCRHFVDYLNERGYRPAVYEGDTPPGRTGVFAREAKGLLEIGRLGRWIASLPKPLALMAGSDTRAQQVLSACGERRIAVPGEVSVTGVGNDGVLCRLCDPQLTSVDLNTEAIGYQAAALVDRMMHGRRPPEELLVVAPRGMVTRQSTLAWAVADADVAAAMQFIRGQCCQRITVDDVARHVALSRSTLQRRFEKALGRTPQTEIHLEQLQRVKQFLADTDLPLSRIAELAGFQHAESLCRLFKRHTGRTPGVYRREHLRLGPTEGVTEIVSNFDHPGH
jgi:LacI family transcriptional regulator